MSFAEQSSLSFVMYVMPHPLLPRLNFAMISDAVAVHVDGPFTIEHFCVVIACADGPHNRARVCEAA